MDISPVILLVFAYSMISERLANLVKQYFPPVMSIFFFWKRKNPKSSPLEFYYHNRVSLLLMNHLNVKQEDYYLETRRERIIAIISLVCGFIIAFSFRKEIRNSLNEVEGLNGIVDQELFIVLGFGILFSFGSKFWHDVLDFILFSKNVRRRSEDIDLTNIKSAVEAKEYLMKTDKKLAQETIDMYEQKFHTQLGKINATIRMIETQQEMDHGKPRTVIVIYVEENVDPNQFPKYWFPPNSTRPFPIRVIGGLGPIEAQSSPGHRLSLHNSPFSGAFCCLVTKDGEDPQTPYLLTCGHVVTEKKVEFDRDEILMRTLFTNDEEGIRVVDFELSHHRDFALLAVDPQKQLHNNNLPDNLKLGDIKILTKNSEGQPIFVVTHNRIEQCTIKKYKIFAEQNVAYENGQQLTFKSLIAIDSEAFGPPTEKGDSGALAYDKDGNAIGMVIGADQRYTYLQSMNSLYLKHRIKPFIQKSQS